MTTLPLIRDTTPGIYQVCTTANTDYTIAIPATARGCIIWFEGSTSDETVIKGRVGFDESNTLVTGITGTDTALGYHPPMPVEYRIEARRANSTTMEWERDAYLHVASGTAGAVVRGMWLYEFDTV